MEGVKSQETEIEEEFCAVMESIKSEDTIIVKAEPNTLTVDSKDHGSEKSSSEVIAQSNGDARIPSSRCRLCAIPNTDMVEIFRSNETAAAISEMIKDCLSIVVRIHSSLFVSSMFFTFLFKT